LGLLIEVSGGRIRHVAPPSVDFHISNGGALVMANIMDAPPPVTFVDNPHAPEVFADRAAGFLNFNGNIRIALESARVNHIATPGPVNRVIVGRLVMPIAEAEALARRLLDFIEQQRSQTPPPPSQSTPPTLQ
jgi:hypothetical protein